MTWHSRCMDGLTFTHDEEKRVYEAHLEGHDGRVGVINYRDNGKVVSITHTGTEYRLQGKGIAGELTTFVLNDLRQRGRLVRPICPYTRRFVRENPDWDDILDQ